MELELAISLGNEVTWGCVITLCCLGIDGLVSVQPTELLSSRSVMTGTFSPRPLYSKAYSPLIKLLAFVALFANVLRPTVPVYLEP